jgi:cytochrome bd-type quinol oxidase subunit 2
MTPRRKQTARIRRRSEVVVAVLVGVGIVAATVLLIWLMRPKSPDGTPGTGGLFTRQPRFVLLLVLAVIVLTAVIAYLQRGRRRPKNMKPSASFSIATVVVVALAVVAGIFWPGGLVRHWRAQPKAEPTDNTTPATPEATTTPTTAAKSKTTRPTTASTAAK